MTEGFVFLKKNRNQIKMLWEMSIVQAGIIQDKIVSMTIQGKRMVKTVTNVCKAKRAATSCKFRLKTKNRQIYLAVIAHIALSKGRVVTVKMKNHLSFGKISLLITISYTQTCAKNDFIHGVIVSTTHYFIQFPKKVPVSDYSL